ncbi:MAG TPA: class I SAM-dependent methyltransferase [Tenuifilaceae bacterium]|nr:class I SAM-dependent methyltransferase [Tenuifilaceae bacterium]HOZ15216.1 class I SAM-dependent methyltransferase [Tenuifilaceae bacterium]HPI45868.1 class I SAM-dependent methyltransferase [Tenuifilaceae bacterium]HPN22101.1 class I SAM-dependent methyltransferase [Tenuifilaceae bacterium]
MRTGLLGQIKNYYNFWLNCKPTGGHGIHSPYIYKLYTEVIEPETKKEVFEKIENYRKELKGCGLSIIKKSINDSLNDGFRGEEISLGKIANSVSIPSHLGRLIYRLAKHYQPKNIVELGTSVGISTMYLAKGNPSASIYTIEGDEAVLGIAQNRFRKFGLTNIQTLSGNFEDQLPRVLNELSSVDFVFIDGDHNGRALINNFNLILPKVNHKTIIIVDDIRWSKGMEKAWEYISSNSKVTLSIDLFRCGILIFEEGITKQNFLLRYGPY